MASVSRLLLAAAAAAGLVSPACLGPDLPSPEELFGDHEYSIAARHTGGPKVLIAPTGPARFAGGLYEALDGPELAAWNRAFAPADAGRGDALDGLAALLAEAGFGALPGLGLEAIATAGEGRRAVVATLEGADRAHEAVVLVTDLGGSADAGPGASPLAAGSQAGLALVLAEALESGELAPPARSVVFLWSEGPEASRAWLARGSHYLFAAVQSRSGQGPGGSSDLHLERWTGLGIGGPSEGEPAGPRPDGLAVVARCAQADVAHTAGGLATSEAPMASDRARSPFVAVGMPMVAFSAPADSGVGSEARGQAAGEALRRLAAAAGATALALADPRPADLERYLLSNREELDAQVGAAVEAGEEDAAARWRERCTLVRHWLRAECLGSAD